MDTPVGGEDSASTPPSGWAAGENSASTQRVLSISGGGRNGIDVFRWVSKSNATCVGIGVLGRTSGGSIKLYPNRSLFFFLDPLFLDLTKECD